MQCLVSACKWRTVFSFLTEVIAICTRIIYICIRLYEPQRCRSGLERSPRMQKVVCSNPSRNKSKSQKQVVTAPLLINRQQVWVSRDDHYKRMSRVTVGVARLRTLTAQWPWVLSVGQILQPFTGNGDVTMSEKLSSRTKKPKTCKQTAVLLHVLHVIFISLAALLPLTCWLVSWKFSPLHINVP